MLNRSRALLAVACCAAFVSLAVENAPVQLPPKLPSASMGIEMDVVPAASQPGKFWLRAMVTDLETQAIIANPKLLIDSDRTARVETGNNDWALAIAVAAGSTSKKARYEATFTRQGKVVARQRFAVDLNS
jgi:hypothetical protein